MAIRPRTTTRTRRLWVETLEPRQLLAFDPSGLEQEFLQTVNRFRADPQAEFHRMVDNINPISSPDWLIGSALFAWGVNGEALAEQWKSLSPAPPLAWNEALYNAAHGHNEQMILHHDQQHQFPGEPDPGQRMRNAGYFGQAWAENIGAYCSTIFECHAGYVIDWGPGPDGIQSPPGHRLTLINGSFREVGIAVTEHQQENFDDVGPLVTTQNFGTRSNQGHPFVLGAVFDDKNDSQWYDEGEGLSAITVKFVGAAGTFQATTLTAGGYQLQLPPGTYTATASGGNLKAPLQLSNIQVGNSNVWVNFFQEFVPGPPDRFEPNNTFDAATQFAAGDVVEDNLSIHDIGDNDYYRWVAPKTGTMNVKLTFSHDDGDLDFTLFDSNRDHMTDAATEEDEETLSWPVTAGSAWYLQVFGYQGAANPQYKLEIDGPGGAVPAAEDDKTATNLNTNVLIDLLANDSDADGDLDRTSVQITQSPQHGTVTIHPTTGAATYSPHADYRGVDRFRYRVSDASDLTSAEATVVIAVVDYADAPWRNPTLPLDADASGVVTPLDALVIINRLNERGPGPLAAQPSGSNSPPPFVDTTGDSVLSALDALRVINFLNEAAFGEGEAASPLVLPRPRATVSENEDVPRPASSHRATGLLPFSVGPRIPSTTVGEQRELPEWDGVEQSWGSLLDILAEDVETILLAAGG